ncbi:CIH_HP2_G0044780.mRNA.1.CDS.1 [Saccharomyces cerevisiae]|nr:CIH_HP2_G0044780.mRNA.1.CDS.1 [Saccharomyces cerevisiae]CAI6676026.1 CIH_HP2_G0044780.mRNA.1.CDS.1 [Saccharomyces cerevisiae]
MHLNVERYVSTKVIFQTTMGGQDQALFRIIRNHFTKEVWFSTREKLSVETSIDMVNNVLITGGTLRCCD